MMIQQTPFGAHGVFEIRPPRRTAVKVIASINKNVHAAANVADDPSRPNVQIEHPLITPGDHDQQIKVTSLIGVSVGVRAEKVDALRMQRLDQTRGDCFNDFLADRNHDPIVHDQSWNGNSEWRYWSAYPTQRAGAGTPFIEQRWAGD